MYINSGGVPEYAEDYGLEFNINNFEAKLEEIIRDYKKYIRLLEKYPFTAEKMCKDYMNLFNHLINDRNKFIELRSVDYKSNKFMSNFYKKIKIKSS